MHQPEIPLIFEHPLELEPDYIPPDLQASAEFGFSRQSVLRCLAVARNLDRGEGFDETTWQPDPERIASLPVEGAMRIGRFLAMSQNLAHYHEKLPESGLREIDQIDPFKALLNFLHPVKPGQPLPLDVTLAHVMAGGYGKMATGWGKMTALAKYADAAGIGKKPFESLDGPPLKALILAYTKLNMNQLVGNILPNVPESEFAEALFDGFAKFAPDIRLTRYFQNEKDLSGDGVVMPYLMFVEAMKKGHFPLDMFDLILADEAHHLTGPRTRELLFENTKRRIPILGVTASPKFSDQKQLSQVLRYPLCDIDKRDSIEIGTISGVQLFWVSTGATIKVVRRQGEYTEEEMEDLAHNKERNRLILDWVKTFVDEGRQVLVPSIKGNECWHSTHLASLSRKLKTPDQETGEERFIVGKAVHSYMSDATFDKIIQDWNEGKVDVLFATDKLRESWNNKLVGAMVLAMVTTSEMVMDQWTGRMARKDEEFPIKPIVYLRDTIIGHKPPMTPHHVLRVELVRQGLIIMEGGERHPHEMRGDPSVRQPEDLPESLQAEIFENPALLSDIILNGRAEDYKDPPETHIPVADTIHLWQGMSYEGVCNLLVRNGYPYVVARGRVGPMRHIHRDAKTFLENYEMPRFAPLDHRVARRIAESLGVSEKYLIAKATEMKLEPTDLLSRYTRQPADHYNPDQIRELTDAIEEERDYKPGDEALVHIGKEFGMNSLTSMLYFFGDRYPTLEKKTPNGHAAVIVRREHARAIRRELKDMEVTEENGRKLIRHMVAESGRERQKILKWGRRMYAEGKLLKPVRRGRYTDPETGKVINEAFMEGSDFRRVIRAMDYHDAQGSGKGICQLAPGDLEELEKERKVLEAKEAAEAQNTEIHDLYEQAILADINKPKRWRDLDEVLEDTHLTWYTLEHHVLPAIETSPSAIMRKEGTLKLWASAAHNAEVYCRDIPTATDTYASVYTVAEKLDNSLELIESCLQQRLSAKPILMYDPNTDKITPHYTKEELRAVFVGIRTKGWLSVTKPYRAPERT